MGSRRTRSVTKRISKNTAYKKGRAFEYRVKRHYEKLGYYVKRSYASKGAEDLLAVKAVPAIPMLTSTSPYKPHKIWIPEVLHIQCKNLKVEKPLSKLEKDNLKKLASHTGGIPLHVYNNSKHKLVIEEIK